MGRTLHKLTARRAETITRKGKHGDGGGLYLIVGNGGRRNWSFIYRDPATSKLRQKGLGPAKGSHHEGLSLHEAREKAAEARAALRAGADPIREATPATTFGAFAERHVASIVTGYRNLKHRAQWDSTLRTYAAPLWSLPIDAITIEHILAVLKPIWETKPETASRVRGRIERVLAAATVRGLRTGANPALWRGNLSELLPRRPQLARGHFKAIPYSELPEFWRELCARPFMSALALQFTILTAARTNETLGAKWSEINFDEKVWTVPASRVKSSREHRVPLVDRAIAILRETKQLDADWCFPSQRNDRPLSNMAMLELLRGMRPNLTVHGFRSAFRDWAGDKTDFPREVAEAALGHIVGDATERAYRRSDAFEKRRKLMEQWAALFA